MKKVSGKEGRNRKRNVMTQAIFGCPDISTRTFLLNFFAYASKSLLRSEPFSKSPSSTSQTKRLSPRGLPLMPNLPLDLLRPFKSEQDGSRRREGRREEGMWGTGKWRWGGGEERGEC